jgi:hypothetical protein
MRLRQAGLKTLKIFLAFIIALALILTCISLTVSMKYSLPFTYVTRICARYALLSVIRLSSRLYDSESGHATVLSPDYKLHNIHFDEFDRIEVFLNRDDIKSHIIIQQMDNKLPIESKYPFDYQAFDEPRLAALRREYRLDDVVAPAKSEFEAMFLLLSWTRSRFRRHDYQPVIPDFDALAILDRNYRNSEKRPFEIGKYYDPCSFFPRLYSQIAISMGYQARLVHISDKGYEGHGMVEVWSNQFNKWVSMDAELDLYYEKDGIPLNLLDVHNERYQAKPSTIKIVRGRQNSGDVNTTMAFLNKESLDVEWVINYHNYFRILDMRNDWMTNHYFKGHPKRSDFSKLTFIDKNMPAIFEPGPVTDSKDIFYWTLDQTEILAQKIDGNGRLQLLFKTITPNFKYFKVKTDSGEEITDGNPLFMWELHPGENSISVCSVNSFGVNGVPSYIRIYSK